MKLAGLQSAETSRPSAGPPCERIGKHVGGFVYVHMDAIPLLALPMQQAIQKAERVAEGRPCECNLVKVDTRHYERVSFLTYESLDKVSFPALLDSLVVDLATGTAQKRSFRTSANPPILHRKELTLPHNHPGRSRFAALTAALEQRGLFDEPSRIGCRRQWQELLASAGIEVVDHILRERRDWNGATATVGNEGVARHRTAITRDRLSVPMQALARHGYISAERTVLDYGCGQGDDVRALRLSGIEAVGWDPHHAPNVPVEPADVVNLGFVLNVIEDPSERADALRRAFTLARVCLCVSVITGRPSEAVAQRSYRDGFLTQRGTFQKYYAQDELKEFLDRVLDREAIAVGPGMYFIFPDEIEEQRFLLERQRRRPSFGLPGIQPRRRRPEKRLPASEKWRTDLEPLWQRMLELGRVPEEAELTDDLLESLQRHFGTMRRANRLCHRLFDEEGLKIAAQRRTDDLVLYFALSQFGRRKAYSHLPVELQRDVKVFFGSLVRAREAGRALLFSLGRPDVIAQACWQTAQSGVGYLREGDALFLHSTLVERLPPQLRCYVACATKLYGDVDTADLVKVHIRSGRLTLLYYDDFAPSPTPTLRQRVKIDLRRQRIDSFDHTQVPSPQVLLMKSRYMTPDQGGYDRQRRFDEQLQSLNLYPRDDYAPSLTELTESLRLAGRRVSGFEVVPLRLSGQRGHMTRLPNLDEMAGRHFRFRDLCEAGTTFAEHHPENVPNEADTYTAMKRLCTVVLDPVVETFGKLEITYGFSGSKLSRLIRRGIAPRLDQHSGHERKRTGGPICDRGGQAVDFRVPGVDSKTVADWIVTNTEFDRLYFYGPDRPLHVSVGPQHNRQVVLLQTNSAGRRTPRLVSLQDFTAGRLADLGPRRKTRLHLR